MSKTADVASKFVRGDGFYRLLVLLLWWGRSGSGEGLGVYRSKNRRRNFSESLHHDAFEAIGNLHQMFSATITISALYQKKEARLRAGFLSFTFSSAVHFPSFFQQPSQHFLLPSSRSLWAEQVKSADLLLLIWGFDWYYCKAWL